MKLLTYFLMIFLVFCFECLQGEVDRKTVLVVGGGGFIGSHVNKMLHQAGYETVVLDNLSRGSRQAIQQGVFIEGDIADTRLLDTLFETYHIDAVMHFAAFIEVGESVHDPLKYYKNNVSNTINLLEAMQRHHVGVFIFSSTAAVFGNPQTDTVNEDHPCNPINPYGQTKLMIEKVVQDVANATDLRFSCLRYFNVAGGDPEGVLKNYKAKESNLIPLLLRMVKRGDTSVTIYGTDYPTVDGTGIRDYVHVADLAAAHILVMEQLFKGASSSFYNLGNGKGFSVREVIAAIERVTGCRLQVIERPRRPGDPAILVSNSRKAITELGWQQRYSSLGVIVSHAWQALQIDSARVGQ